MTSDPRPPKPDDSNGRANGIDPPPVFTTVADTNAFLGTVALLNSLRLCGHPGTLFVLDAGLTRRERRLLESACVVIDAPPHGSNPTRLKPFIGSGLVEPVDGPVVVVDSDVIVTSDLRVPLEIADAGSVCAFEDVDSSRWFGEWQARFGLSVAPRRGRYVNAAFVAMDTSKWSWLLERWWSSSMSLTASETLMGGARYSVPTAHSDQDALNALLMSEVEQQDLVVLDNIAAPWSPALLENVEVTDARRLVCRQGSHEVLLLHHGGRPKPWENIGLLGRQNAYRRLLPRLLLADDVKLRVSSRDVPPWLRYGLGWRSLAGALEAGNAVSDAVLDRVPESTRLALRKCAYRLVGTGGSRRA